MTATVDTPALRRLDGLERATRSRPRPASRPSTPSMGYQPGLDGLRAVSVIAVICYHAGFGWMHGGFFGVEVFFVVSGFLITSLLIEERDRTGRIALRQFWYRRARRSAPGPRCSSRHGRDVGGGVRVRRAVVAAPTRPAVVDLLRRQLGSDPRRRALLRGRRPAAAATPVEPRRRGAVVPALAVRVRRCWRASGSRRRSARAGWSASRSTIMAFTFWLHSGDSPLLGGPPALFDGVGSNEPHVLVDGHPVDRPAARRGGGVRVAPVAYAGCGAARPGTAARRRVRRRDRDAGVHLRRRRDHRGLRVPVAAAARVAAVVGRGAHRRAPVGARRTRRVLHDAAGRDRPPQLRPVPVALADLRVRRSATTAPSADSRLALAVTAIASELCYQYVETPIREGAFGFWWSRQEPSRWTRLALGERSSSGCWRSTRTSSSSTPRPAAPTPSSSSPLTPLGRPKRRSASRPPPNRVRPIRRIRPDKSNRPVNRSARPPSRRRSRSYRRRRRGCLATSRSSATRRPTRWRSTCPTASGETFVITDGSLDGCGVHASGRVRTAARGSRTRSRCARAGSRSGRKPPPRPTWHSS